MTDKAHPRSRRKRPRTPHQDTGLRPVPFPHAKDTPQSLFTGWGMSTISTLITTDGHPDPLRTWRDHGNTCPEDWYVVRPRILGSAKQSLLMMVERNSLGSPVGGRFPFAMMRTAWWTPSREHAQEVARQITADERSVFHSATGSAQPLRSLVGYVPVSPETPDLVTLNVHSVDAFGDPLPDATHPILVWNTAAVEIQVYQRVANGPHPRLVSRDTARFRLTSGYARHA